ncbi:MAG: spore maturation protein [Clostridiales bacterium]|nr:spore maturation protein [Clostridiales bacterium]
MLNIIWLVLLGGGVLYAALNGNIDAVSQAAFAAAGDAVRLGIEMCGVLCLWLGLLKLAEDAGLIRLFARMITPVARLLFPAIPKDDPAISVIVMNIAANMLGLGNAATPFGLKAMEHLQRLNPQKDTASAPMITMLVLNTSGITLIPTLVISLRSQAGSMNPTEIVGATIIASTCGACFAVILDAILRHRETWPLNARSK